MNGGTWYVMPTAFDSDGRFDASGQRTLTEAVLEWGVDGVTILGVMGEASALSSDERAAVIRATLEATAERFPVAVGCSASARHTAAALVEQARSLGADYAMVAAPTLLRDVDRLPSFFQAVRETGGLPLVLQDEPAATGVNVPVSVWVRCLAESASSVIKLEDPPTATKISQLLAVAPQTAVFGGLGGMSSFYELHRGAAGTMTGFSFPEVLRSMRTTLVAGDERGAFDIYRRFLPVIAFEAQPVVGLGIRKAVLKRRGALASAMCRIGSASIGKDLDDELSQVLDHVGFDSASGNVAV